jgi:hypothetical protein
MPHINIVAALVAAISSFLLGGLWYSRVLFGTTLVLYPIGMS